MALADDLITAFGAGAALAVRVGQVTAVPGVKVTVTVGGGPMSLPRLAFYSAPAAGDVVLILASPGAWIVLGKIAT